MKKIIITSSQPDKEGLPLAAMLNVLFPECEIQVTAWTAMGRAKKGAPAKNRNAVTGEYEHGHGHQGASR